MRIRTSTYATLILAAAAASAQAVTATWNNSAGGEWGTSSASAANWTGGNPGVLAGDTATINLVTGASYIIYKNNNFTTLGSLAAFTMDTPDAILELPGGTGALRPIYMSEAAIAEVKRGTIRVKSGSSNAIFSPKPADGTGTVKLGAGSILDVQTQNGVAATINAPTFNITQMNGQLLIGTNGDNTKSFKKFAQINNSVTNAGTIQISNQWTGAVVNTGLDGYKDTDSGLNVVNGTLTNTGTIQVLKGNSDGTSTNSNKRELNLILNNQGTLEVQNAGLRAATLGVVAGGSHTNTGTIAIAAGTTLAMTASNTLTSQSGGVIEGLGTFDVSAGGLANNGSIAPGGDGASGVFTVNGAFANSDTAILAVELGGTAAGSGYDQLLVTGGVAALDGSLDVSLLGGFTPGAADVFTILAGDYTGTFDNVVNGKLALGNGYEFDVSYESSSIELSNYAQVPEPGALAVLGMAGLAFLRRRRA